MADKYTAEWLREQVKEHGYTTLMHHDCSICGTWVYYSFEGDEMFFHPACDCAPRHQRAPASRRSYDDVAHWLKIQQSDEMRDRILARFRPNLHAVE